MAKRKPGFAEASGSRNTRTSRFNATGDNDTDARHIELTAITLSFTAPDLINDSGNDLVKFRAGSFITVEGSAAQDATYEIDTVAAGQIQTIEQTITTEGAGASMRIKSTNNRNVNRAA